MVNLTVKMKILIVITCIFSFTLRSDAFSTPIVACSSQIELHRAISFYIQPNDCVLELGAQLSETSSIICNTIGVEGHATLVDITRSDAKSGRCSNRETSRFLGGSESIEDESYADRVTYRELDEFSKWRELINGIHQYQVLILDAGTMIGNDLHLTALTIANEFVAHQETHPRVVIVKSKNLSSLARRIVHSQRLLDGTVKLPSDLKRSHEPFIISSVGVQEYRRTIPFTVLPGDEVLEVGCHFGRTTSILHNAASVPGRGFCIGVDIGPKIIEHAREQNSHITFEVCDAWKALELIKIKQRLCPAGQNFSLGYDVVYADIGGLSGANGLFESLSLLELLSKSLEPRSIVIKSLCMNRLASQLVAFSSVWNKISPTLYLNEI
jgi:2-polyprenyl-3-methyl-5-hydroxy-6-metoxy-1,4-benzoquinol methylase